MASALLSLRPLVHHLPSAGDCMSGCAQFRQPELDQHLPIQYIVLHSKANMPCTNYAALTYSYRLLRRYIRLSRSLKSDGLIAAALKLINKSITRRLYLESTMYLFSPPQCIHHWLSTYSNTSHKAIDNKNTLSHMIRKKCNRQISLQID